MGNFENKTMIPYINPFPNKPWFSCVCSTCLLKTLRKKEKLLITLELLCANSFSLEGSKTLSFGKGLKAWSHRQTDWLRKKNGQNMQNLVIR